MHQLDFTHEREIGVDDLVRRIKGYNPDADESLIRRAYAFAVNCHKGQKRSSGEDYFIHPVNVASALTKLQMDVDSIIAGLLHDVIEDCGVTEEELVEQFSPDIAQIVVGLTKISKINFKTKEESQAENFRKMVVAMAKDLRVIIVKLADRMHNMRTLQYVSEEKQKKKAQETLDIYVPLASRLGINSVKSELEDLCLRFLKPDIYYRLAEKVAMKKREREAYIRETISIIHEKLLEYSLKAEAKGRPKHFYSIYKKMMARGVDFDQIQDVLAFRIIVQNITECYKCLGIVHSSFTPIPGRFKDYIAIPKINNYQSLHTTVLGPRAERIEIQIRTFEMDEIAETGVAAHWKYKEGLKNNGKKLAWIEELLEYNKSFKSGSELMDVVKNDLDIGGVFVFTPKGEVYELKYGATPLDFAYSVHTEVGNQCVGAKVNGKIVPLRHRLKSGDSVEILTSRSQRPTKDWLNIVKTSRAKSKIKQYLLKVEREKNIEMGRDILDRTFRIFNSSIKSMKKNGTMDKIVAELNCRSDDDLLAHIGGGKYNSKQIIEMIPQGDLTDVQVDREKELEEIDTFSQTLSRTARKKSHKDDAVIVDGMNDVMVRMARCCNPIPGDPIVGYITRGRGITVHTNSCTRIDTCELGRQVDVQWNSDFSFRHPVNIRIVTHDKPGMLSQISHAINSLGINIKSAIAKSMPDRKGSFIFEIEVTDYSELLRVIGSIESLDEVLSVMRA